MHIDKFSEKYIDEVAELEKLCFSHPISKENLKMLLPGGIGQGFVLTDGNKAVSYGGIIMAADEGQILNIATHPSFRRRGYAGKIMEQILSLADEKGINVITLEVRESNLGAIKLYESLGFYSAGLIKGYYADPKENGIIMRFSKQP